MLVCVLPLFYILLIFTPYTFTVKADLSTATLVISHACSQEVSCEGYLICGVDELHSFVGHREHDGWHFLHLFCRLLGAHKINKQEKDKRGSNDFGGITCIKWNKLQY